MPKRRIRSLTVEEKGENFYGVKKQKGYTHKQLPIDEDWTLPEFVHTDILTFLQIMNGTHDEDDTENINLMIIQNEVNQSMAGGKKPDSQSLLGAIEINFPDNAGRCKTARSCLFEVVKAHLSSDNAIEVLSELPLILEILIPNVKNDSIYRSKIHVFIRENLGVPLLNRIKQDGRFALSASQKIRIGKAAASKVDEQLASPIIFDEKFILRNADMLKKSSDLYEMIAFALLCSGSRIVEILLVSDYEVVTTGHKPQEEISKFLGYISALPVAKEGSQLRRINKRFQELKSLNPSKNITFEDVQEQVMAEGGLSIKNRYFPALFQEKPQDFVELINRIRSKLNNTYTWYKNLDRNKSADLVKISSKISPGVNKVLDKLQWRSGGGHKTTSRSMRKLFARYSYIVNAPIIPFLLWTKKVLAHNNSNTSRSYLGTHVRTVVKLEEDPSLITQMARMVTDMHAMRDEWRAINENAVIATRGTVLVQTEQGDYVHWEKQPNLRDGKDAKMKRLKKLIEDFKDKKIKINRKNVNAVGFGAAIWYEYLKRSKLEK